MGSHLAIAVAAVLALLTPALATVSVRDFGAVGDGKHDDSAAFAEALAKCAGELSVPAGTYRIAGVKVPDGTLVRGVGVKSVIAMPAEAEAAMLPGNDCTLSSLRFVGSADDKASPIQKGLVRLQYVSGVTLTGLVFESSPRSGIITDHANHFRITDSRFAGVALGIHLIFSDHGLVSGNFIRDAKAHGIQFWGNWEFRDKLATDLVFTGNHVQNAGGGGIWGTGGVRVVMSGNVVDGAGDVGLDYEWCDDSSITGNTVRSATNAGISLFYGCENITISGNSVVVTEGKEGLRYGIWLTDPDRPKFAKDLGHRVIAITGNTVRIEGAKPGHALCIGTDSHDLAVVGNLFANGDVVDHTGKVQVR
jgi:parallel beta-helix repeat protein